MALSIVLLALDSGGHLHFVRSTMSTFVYPLQYVTALPVRFLSWAGTSVESRKQLLEENARLRNEHLLLNARLQRYFILENENRRLRGLLESRRRFRGKVALARLIAVEMSQKRQRFVIDKGEQDGAFVGQAIVDASGIVGQLVEVGMFSSTVLLLTDPSHAIPVEINRNGIRAVAEGRGEKDRLYIDHLPSNQDVAVGDLVVSSGLGQRYPRAYPVGIVRQATLGEGEPFLQVIVEPSARLGQSREVLMVWPQRDRPGPDGPERQP